jgi:hypothetical protein
MKKNKIFCQPVRQTINIGSGSHEDAAFLEKKKYVLRPRSTINTFLVQCPHTSRNSTNPFKERLFKADSHQV